jgi:hypothetical protein
MSQSWVANFCARLPAELDALLYFAKQIQLVDNLDTLDWPPEVPRCKSAWKTFLVSGVIGIQ